MSLEVTPDAPTTCAHCHQSMRWDGTGWVHGSPEDPQHIQCDDCGKCRVGIEEEWCSDCGYWSCERGPDCADEVQS